jgi:hypothetical protein
MSFSDHRPDPVELTERATALAKSTQEFLSDHATSLAKSTRESFADVHQGQADALATSIRDAYANNPGLRRQQSTNGGKMSLQEVIHQVSSLQQSIKDQIVLINEFLKSNSQTIELVRTQLQGSTRGYDQQMLSALTQTESTLQHSRSKLEQASTALDRVRMI